MKYNKSYWRVDAQYQTIQHVNNVSDTAPVGVWIHTIGKPYAYFESESAAKAVLKAILQTEINRMDGMIKEIDNVD